MSEIRIDIEAVQRAQQTLRPVVDTVSAQMSSHNNASAQLEGLLRAAASSVLDALNPLHRLDPFGIWNHWNFGSVVGMCLSTRGALDNSRGTTHWAVQQVCDAHSYQLAPVIADRASRVDPAFGAALEGLWSINQYLNPGAIRSFIQNPWAILQHFNAVGEALWSAQNELASFSQFLAQLEARDQQLLDDIRRLLQQAGTTAVVDVLHLNYTSVANGVGDALSIASLFSDFGPWGDGIGTVADIITDDPRDIHRDAGDVVGNMLMVKVGASDPEVGAIITVLAALPAIASGVGAFQSWLASSNGASLQEREASESSASAQVDSDIDVQLQHSATYMNQAASNVRQYNINKDVDDLGTVIVDTHGHLPVGADAKKLLIDTGMSAFTAIQATGVEAYSLADDALLLSTPLIQNLPRVPRSVKAAWPGDVDWMMGQINNVAHDLTHGPPQAY